MNCWEYMKCPNDKKQNCDVFLYGHGKECWQVPKENYKGNKSSSKSCIHCPWYIKNYKKNKI